MWGWVREYKVLHYDESSFTEKIYTAFFLLCYFSIVQNNFNIELPPEIISSLESFSVLYESKLFFFFFYIFKRTFKLFGEFLNEIVLSRNFMVITYNSSINKSSSLVMGVLIFNCDFRGNFEKDSHFLISNLNCTISLKFIYLFLYIILILLTVDRNGLLIGYR